MSARAGLRGAADAGAPGGSVVGHIDLRPAQEHAARRWLKHECAVASLLAVGGVLMVSVVVRRFALIIAVALASVLCITPGAGATRRSIDVEAIGHPIWKPVDCHLFSAAIGTAATAIPSISRRWDHSCRLRATCRSKNSALVQVLLTVLPTTMSWTRESAPRTFMRERVSGLRSSRPVKVSSWPAWWCRGRELAARHLTLEQAESYPTGSSRSTPKEPPTGISASSTRTSTSKCQP